MMNFAHHLQVEHRPLVQPLRLQELPFLLQPAAIFVQLALDRLGGLLGALARGHEMRLREHRDVSDLAEDLAGQRVEPGQFVHLVAEEADPQCVLLVGGHDFDDIAAHAERAAPELDVVALVLDLHQFSQDLVAVDPLADLEREQHAVVRLGRPQAVDARHTGHDDDVAALEERPRGRQPHPVDLVVDGRFLLDVRVGGRHVGFGLVIVVVADEVLDGVLGKEPAELLIQLRRQRLVVRHHQRGPVHLRHDLRHRERLARSGHAKEHLERVPPVHPLDELGHGADLVAGHFEVADELERVLT
jgi:hypothetical protein